MEYVGSGLIGFLFKAFAIVLLSGIIVLLLVPQKIKPVISIISTVLIAVVTSILALKVLLEEV